MSARIKSLAELPERYRTGGYEAIPSGITKPRKYRNQPITIDGERFDSKLEARYYEQLKLRVASTEVKWFIRQAPFRLEGGVVYRADFLVVRNCGGDDFVEVVDCKGFLTRSTMNKIKQVKARYGLDVILWRGEQGSKA